MQSRPKKVKRMYFVVSDSAEFYMGMKIRFNDITLH